MPFDRDGKSDFSNNFRHIGIYVYQKNALAKICDFHESKIQAYEKLEQLRALANGLSIGSIVVAKTPVHGTDTKEDYLKLITLMSE